MKILLLTEDNSILEENSPKNSKLLEYSSFVNGLFVIILTNKNKNSFKTKRLTQNAWIYQAISSLKILRIINAFKLASFEVKANGVFQADLIICEDQFISTIAGYFLSKKFRRPLYIFLTDENERKLFYPTGVIQIIKANFLWFIFKRADCIKVDNLNAKEKLLKKSSSIKVELIKPFVDFQSLLPYSLEKSNDNEKIIKKKFAQLRFTSVVYISDIKQFKIAISILEGLNRYFPPTSMVILISDNLKSSKFNNLIKKNLKPFVYVDSVNSDLIKYLSESNVFLGISSGDKYEAILNKACAVGARVIALKDESSIKLIEDGVTGFICPPYHEEDIINYFINRTFVLMKDPLLAMNFKVNLPLSFKKQFNNTNDDYINSLKMSLESCLENYKKSHKKYYEY